MAKKVLGKKAIALIIVLAVLVVGGGCFGITYAVLHRQLEAPTPSISAITAEPDYTIDIAWNKVSGAEYYSLEYKHSLYPDETIEVSKIGGTSYSIKRVKGTIEFRVKSIGKYASNTSEFSEWIKYDVDPLTLDTFRAFNFSVVEDKGYLIDMDSFNAVNYVYKGNNYTVNYYEIAVHSTEENVTLEEIQCQTYSLTQLEEGIYFNFAPGTWNVYARPVLYVEINGIKDYTQAEGLYDLYDENIDYTTFQLIV